MIKKIIKKIKAFFFGEGPDLEGHARDLMRINKMQMDTDEEYLKIILTRK